MRLKIKQIANAFQGLSEKQIKEFIEKCLGEKLERILLTFMNK